MCISFLEISGSPSHLRCLIRRLRDRLPGRPILVGLWPADDAVLGDERLRSAIGADEYTTSLRAAVEICLRRAAAENGQGGSRRVSPLRLASATRDFVLTVTLGRIRWLS